MKKLSILFLGFAVLSIGAISIQAETVRMQKQNLQNALKQERQEIKNDIKNATGESKRGLIDQLKDRIKSKLPKRIHGKLTLINGSVLSVISDNGITYMVTITSNTQLRRRFGGAATLSEFSIGDELAVIGNRRKTSDTEFSETEIDAKYIRNLSIQRRNAVFNGTVTSKETLLFKIQTQSRGVQTVNINNATIYTQKDQKILYADLQIGDKVIVKGELWDRASDNINAKKVMKLVRSTITVTPTPTD